MTSTKKNIFIFALILFMLLLAAYANHFHNAFHFDDKHTIVDNTHIRTLKNIPQFFRDPTMFSISPDHYGLRPLVTTTLAIDYWLGGNLDPFYFHVSTFIWHILLCMMLFFVYKKLMTDSYKHSWVNYMALFAAGWFAIHTANAETINYIISRSDVLSTFFIVASFLIYIAYPEKRKWCLYIIPAVIGVFAKETVLVLIILLFFYILLFEKKLAIADLFKAKNFKIVLNIIVMLLPLLIVVVAVQVYTLTRITAIPGISNPAGYYWLTQCFVWLHYFTSFFFPTSLSADTDWEVILSVFDKRILIGILFVIGLIIAIFRTSKKTETKPISFGLIWFAAALLPTSVAPFAEVMNDHRMYFAFVGLALSVVWFISLWLIKKEKQITSSKTNQVLIIGAVLLILSLNAYGVRQRNKIWFSEETLWYDVTIKSPLNGRGLMNYGLTQMATGNYDGAISYFEKALKLLPNYNRLYVNLGIAMGEKGMHEKAELNFKRGILLAEKSYESYVFYARYLKNNTRFSEAKIIGEKALSLNPQALLTLNILMEVYLNLGLWADLERTANTVLSILPGDANGARYLAAAKQRNEILPADLLAKKNPTAEDLLNLSLSFYNTGNYLECIEFCKKALIIRPKYADAYSNMAAAFNKLEQWDKGIEASKKALEINPNHTLAKGNLNWAMARK